LAVQTFATTRDAKEFLVSRIITESQREGVPLSEVEVKMLYFSETAWTLPDIAEVNDAFDRDHDQTQYEQKIGRLIRSFRATARKNNRDEFDTWSEAARTIRREDHYLLVLIAAAKESSSMSWGRFQKLSAIGFLIACVILVVGYLVLKR
jgi:hypothetical protein